MSGALSYTEGAPIVGLYPTAQAAVLQAVSLASGVATPTTLAATEVILSPANTTIALMPANPNRTFLLIYNPTQLPAQFSLGQATLGGLNNLSIGPGQAYFWATAQGLLPVYTGALTAVGLVAGMPLWLWEDGADFWNNGGVLAFLRTPATWPTSAVGLPPGAVWNNTGEPAIVGGAIPDPTAAPMFFGAITANALLVNGGGNLPLTNPGLGTLRLWNDGGVVAIA